MAFMESFLPAYMQHPLETMNLSPTLFYLFTFLTLLASACIAFYFMQPATRKSNRPSPPPQQLGAITREELREYDGRDPTKPLLVAVRGRVYDVSESMDFYGPGSSYSIFAGKEASRAMAKMSFDEKDLTDELRDLSPQEEETLREWEYKLTNMYPKVGYLAKSKSPSKDQLEHMPPGLSTSTKADEDQNPKLGHTSKTTIDEADEVDPYIEVTKEAFIVS